MNFSFPWLSRKFLILTNEHIQIIPTIIYRTFCLSSYSNEIGRSDAFSSSLWYFNSLPIRIFQEKLLFLQGLLAFNFAEFSNSKNTSCTPWADSWTVERLPAERPKWRCLPGKSARKSGIVLPLPIGRRRFCPYSPNLPKNRLFKLFKKVTNFETYYYFARVLVGFSRLSTSVQRKFDLKNCKFRFNLRNKEHIFISKHSTDHFPIRSHVDIRPIGQPVAPDCDPKWAWSLFIFHQKIDKFLQGIQYSPAGIFGTCSREIRLK